MNYRVYYSCCSHLGKYRSINQDNFYCDGMYMLTSDEELDFPIGGCQNTKEPLLFAVFDGMGGEECGEKAALIAAECASKCRTWLQPIEDLADYCRDANEQICRYANNNDICSMGTTVAILLFAENGIYMCNIGDSKVFRFNGKKLEQISVDDYAAVPYGKKPPLSQNLGIPPKEFVIEPHLAKGRYCDGDIYLLCSDGLTDMVAAEEIARILRETEYKGVCDKLLDKALDNGGRDNITIIVCKVEKNRHGLFGKLFDL